VSLAAIRVGIDLGTTHTVAAWSLPGQRPRVLRLKVRDRGGGFTTCEKVSSAVYVPPEGSPVVGPLALTLAMRDERVVWRHKLLLGTGWNYPPDTGCSTPRDAARCVLHCVLSEVRRQLAAERMEVLVTVPASFDGDRRAETLAAMREVGIATHDESGAPLPVLLDEPRAALLDFLDRCVHREIPACLVGWDRPRNLLVVDMGGGTLDVSLHEVRLVPGSGTEIQDLAIGRYTELGGDEIDRRIAARFRRELALDLAEISDTEARLLDRRLVDAAEHAKIALVEEVLQQLQRGTPLEACQADVPVEVTDLPGGRHLVTTHGVRDHLEVLHPLLAEEAVLGQQAPAPGTVLTPVFDVLARARGTDGVPVEVDEVLLNGGATRCPWLVERLTRLFGKPPLVVGDPDLAVARGAAIGLDPGASGIDTRPLLPETLGLEVDGRLVVPLVPAGTPLPYTSLDPIRLEVPVGGITCLDMPFWVGDRPDTLPPNRPLARRSIPMPTAVRVGDVIAMWLTVDRHQGLSVRLQIEGSSDPATSVTLDPTAAPPTEVAQGPMNAPPVEGPPASPRVESPLEPVHPVEPDPWPDEMILLDDGSGSSWVERPPRPEDFRDLTVADPGPMPLDDWLATLHPTAKPAALRATLVHLVYRVSKRPDRFEDVTRRLEPLLDPYAWAMLTAQARNEWLSQVITPCLMVLARMGSPTSEDMVLGVLDWPEWAEIWPDALYALGRVGQSTRALDLTCRLAEARESRLVLPARWALGQMASPQTARDPRVVWKVWEWMASLPCRPGSTHELAHVLYVLGELSGRFATALWPPGWETCVGQWTQRAAAAARAERDQDLGHLGDIVKRLSTGLALESQDVERWEQWHRGASSRSRLLPRKGGAQRTSRGR